MKGSSAVFGQHPLNQADASDPWGHLLDLASASVIGLALRGHAWEAWCLVSWPRQLSLGLDAVGVSKLPSQLFWVLWQIS